MENSYRFFENKDCKYYPCHEGIGEMNCLFCFCPLYGMEKCPGSPKYRKIGEKTLKDCSACVFPHRPENYGVIMELLKDAGGRQ